MFRKHRILFPVDFSLACRALAPTVRKMIECWQSEVTVLHIIEGRQWPRRKQELERLMLGLRSIARALGDRQVSCRLERGAAGDRILQYARANLVDLIVISARSRSGLRGAPTGSVAGHVLSEAGCGVWLDWCPAGSRAATGMNARRVGCALAHPDTDEFVLRQAEDISGELNAGLTVVQAVQLPRDRPFLLLREQRARAAALALAKSRIDKLGRSSYPSAEIAVDVGSHRTVIRRVIQSQAMGLLVTGNQREVILAAESQCPVLRVATPIAAAASNLDWMLAAGSCA
jgi:nucleotide-binding universal stress UspA family protein